MFLSEYRSLIISLYLVLITLLRTFLVRVNSPSSASNSLNNKRNFDILVFSGNFSFTFRISLSIRLYIFLSAVNPV